MLMGDFLTLVQHDLPVKAVVFNNGSLGFIEIEQKSSGFLDTGTTLKNPDFAAMAESIGVRGIRLEDPGDVESGVAEALAHDGSVLIDVVVSRMVLPIPPRITAEMAKGFSLYMLKAIEAGRGDELIDLVRAGASRQAQCVAFMFCGEGLFIFPLMLFYTTISYSIFRGQSRLDIERILGFWRPQGVVHGTDLLELNENLPPCRRQRGASLPPSSARPGMPLSRRSPQ
jgi:Thiamine pyrophosphate enzyme, C-terminal TPP binding domain